MSGTEAIQRMRELSKVPCALFKLVHLTYDRKRSKSNGKRIINKCVLRPSLPEDIFDVDSDHYLPYKDVENDKPGQCFKILIRFVGFPPDFALIKINWFDHDKD